MEIKNGIYQIKNPEIGIEEHGGAKIKFEVYWNLCFYPNKKIGLFGGNKTYYKPYFSKIFPFNGDIIIQDINNIKFSLLNRNNNESVIFDGTITKNSIHLVSYKEKTPVKLWMNNEEFEWLDLDYEQLQMEFDEGV